MCVCVCVPSIDGSVFSKALCPSCEVSALRAVKNFFQPLSFFATHCISVSIRSVSFRVELLMLFSSSEVSKPCSLSLGIRTERFMYLTQAGKNENVQRS